MPNPIWPLDLPQSVSVNYSETSLPNSISSTIDAGPAKIRKRFENQIRRFSVTQYHTIEQKQIFQEFHQENEANRFDWRDPTDNSAAECRFVPSVAPQYQRISPTHYLISFSFEILP